MWLGVKWRCYVIQASSESNLGILKHVIVFYSFCILFSFPQVLMSVGQVALTICCAKYDCSSWLYSVINTQPDGRPNK